ncbi:hypothetical protein [Jiangella alba]|uniref:Uncharacterized protein n=1 Tax=Jiangella alba TaxID=561176 RepID=A0A1H5PT68_9ACTN|nr:hypothetical protein [Jiangella alba]SEF17050.1 hypothetical protein SAMN04488561_5674 [Jiangella alba]
MVGGSLAVAAALQVASWTSEPTGWDGVDEPAPTAVPGQPMPPGYQMSPECQDEYEAAVREAEETGATLTAVLCELGPPRDPDERPTIVSTPPSD